MTSPEECEQRFPDDSEVKDTVCLLRRIPPRHFISDRNDGVRRPSSAAFEDDDDGDPMSVYRIDVIEAEGGQPARVMAGHEDFGLANIRAGLVRQKDQTVHPDPLPEETSHTKICGPKTRGRRRYFAKHCKWIIPPPS